jgi:hypothetical protein
LAAPQPQPPAAPRCTQLPHSPLLSTRSDASTQPSPRITTHSRSPTPIRLAHPALSAHRAAQPSPAAHRPSWAQTCNPHAAPSPQPSQPKSPSPQPAPCDPAQPRCPYLPSSPYGRPLLLGSPFGHLAMMPLRSLSMPSCVMPLIPELSRSNNDASPLRSYLCSHHARFIP